MNLGAIKRIFPINFQNLIKIRQLSFPNHMLNISSFLAKSQQNYRSLTKSGRGSKVRRSSGIGFGITSSGNLYSPLYSLKGMAELSYNILYASISSSESGSPSLYILFQSITYG